MPPPKARLHKTTGKPRSGPSQIIQNHPNNPELQPGTSSGTSTASLNPEQEQQFEAEIYWCIQQLQTALSSNKLNNKQIQDHTKALNTLMSNTAPMIKKRQVMRLSFGDYREKMAADEKKTREITMTVSSGKPNQKSVFIKKALITPTENNFKFNFSTPENEPNFARNGHLHQVAVKPNSDQDYKIPAYVKSDNSFKFNFSHEECSGDNDS